MSIGPLGPGGPGQWDDLFARFFGAAEPRRAQRIDITKYMSNDAREVLSAAARRAAELADADRLVADLDTDHLLWGALQQDAMKQTVRRAGADPDQLLAGQGGKTPTLEQYGVDLTELARRGEIDPVIGRADEIEQAVEILSRRTKNNPGLIGEAGVGKT